jgi:hypothetical protein
VKQKSFIYLLLLIQVLLLSKCNSVDPPPPPNGEKPTLTLTLEDVSCIEAWIKPTTTNIQLPASITLQQNNQNRKTINLVKADTLIYVDSLLPNTRYQYQVSSIEYQVSSNEISVTTMDTTSHDFTFETFTFGGTAGSSTLYDVATIDENNIWAVGEILVADTSVNGYTTYNAIHWDGSQWELNRILYQGGFWVIRTIFAFNENDIWFSAFVRYDGQNFIELPIPPILIGWTINKIWGSSSDDLYIVGNNGNIARYLNGTWSRIESGTDLNIYDVWGQINKDNEYDILCVASNSDILIDSSKVLKIEGTSIKEISNEGLPVFISTLWFIPERKYYIAGDGLYTAKHLGAQWICDNSMPPYYKTSIRGNGFNDIVMTGAFGLLLHFNGLSWKNFQNITYIEGAYGEVAVKGNLICCTGGLNNGQAIILMGRR